MMSTSTLHQVSIVQMPCDESTRRLVSVSDLESSLALGNLLSSPDASLEFSLQKYYSRCAFISGSSVSQLEPISICASGNPAFSCIIVGQRSLFSFATDATTVGLQLFRLFHSLVVTLNNFVLVEHASIASAVPRTIHLSLLVAPSPGPLLLKSQPFCDRFSRESNP